MKKYSPLYWFTIIVSCIAFLSVTLSHAASQPPIPVGRVVWIKGNLKAIMENKEERILKEKSIIYLHDTLVTDANSLAEVGFTDQTLITFRQNTKFVISQYKYSPASKNAGGHSVMNLLTGGFRTITGAIAEHSPNEYSVNTPVSTIGVRGTNYQIAVKNGATYIGRYSGVPFIKANSRLKCPAAANRPLVLSGKVHYAKIAGPCSKPEVLTTKPDVFNGDDLPIVKAYIEPFATPASSNGNENPSPNSFCIQ